MMEPEMSDTRYLLARLIESVKALEDGTRPIRESMYFAITPFMAVEATDFPPHLQSDFGHLIKDTIGVVHDPKNLRANLAKLDDEEISAHAETIRRLKSGTEKTLKEADEMNPEPTVQPSHQ